MTGERKPDFITICLRGASQVFFMENALTGSLFLAAILYASFLSGNWATSIGAVLALVIATLTALTLQCDRASIDSGLFGFNGILAGVALPTFIAATPALWLYITVGAAFSTVVTAALAASLTKSWGVPGSTGPFVLVGWMLLAGAHVFGHLQVLDFAPKLASDYVRGAMTLPNVIEMVQIFFRNIAQVFLLSSAVSGALILMGIFIASVPAGIAAACGSVVAIIFALLLGADPAVVAQGLFGFSPVLTAMAVGVVFMTPSPRVAAYAALATVVTVFLQGALDVIMLPDGLPSFTAPYVLTMYLFVLPKKLLTPHPHAPMQRHLLLAESAAAPEAD
jgi:urea transporter